MCVPYICEHVCIYADTCMYVCMCIYMCMSVYIYRCISECMHVCAHAAQY